MKNLLTRYGSYSPEYNNGLSNHLPMGLLALSKLGASPERLEQFAKNYLRDKKITSLSRGDVVIDKKNWATYLGKNAHYESYVDFYRKENEALGQKEMLTTYLDSLIPGLAGGGFHGLIRLGYALEWNDPEEIIRALAYFSICYLAPELPENMAVCSDPLVEITKLSLNPYYKEKEYKGNTISERISGVFQDSRFKETACSLGGSYIQEALAGLTLLLYAETENFTMLHGVTSIHALRIVQPYLKDQEKGWLYYWNALLGAYISIGCPELKNLDYSDEKQPPWKEIFAVAIESEEVHAIKLVYSCFEESVVYSHLPYREQAARKVGLAPVNR